MIQNPSVDDIVTVREKPNTKVLQKHQKFFFRSVHREGKVPLLNPLCGPQRAEESNHGRLEEHHPLARKSLADITSETNCFVCERPRHSFCWRFVDSRNHRPWHSVSALSAGCNLQNPTLENLSSKPLCRHGVQQATIRCRQMKRKRELSATAALLPRTPFLSCRNPSNNLDKRARPVDFLLLWGLHASPIKL